MGMKSEARLTSSLLARKGSAQPFSAADVFSLPPQTVVTPGVEMDERAEGRRPQPNGWSSSPVTPPPARQANAEASKAQATDQAHAEVQGGAKPSQSWTTQSIFSALQRTPGLHPAADGATARPTSATASKPQETARPETPETPETPRPETPRKVSSAAVRGVIPGDAPAASSAKDRVALTLRVDQDRHTRLRVLAAQTKRSSQDILMAALDSYIDGASEGMRFCECLKPSAACCKTS